MRVGAHPSRVACPVCTYVNVYDIHVSLTGPAHVMTMGTVVERGNSGTSVLRTTHWIRPLHTSGEQKKLSP